jgi:hypothetical protein
VLFSADSGATWTRKISPGRFSIRAVWPEDAARAFAAGENGTIYYTTDQGNSWFSQYTADTHDLQALHFTDPSHGFAVGSGGTVLVTSSAGTTTTVPAANSPVPEVFALEQNYPNPFNPVTTITFTIPGGSVAGGSGLSPVELAVYDMLGRQVATIVRENMAPGAYSVRFDAARLASGVYLYRLMAGGRSFTKKMVILK